MPFPMKIRPKMNVIARPEFELAYYKMTTNIMVIKDY